jgi:hypothetical protein
MTDISKATTLPRSKSAAVRARGTALLLPQQVVTSPETRLDYRIESLLGQGGFGQAYLASRISYSSTVPAVRGTGRRHGAPAAREYDLTGI